MTFEFIPSKIPQLRFFSKKIASMRDQYVTKTKNQSYYHATIKYQTNFVFLFLINLFQYVPFGTKPFRSYVFLWPGKSAWVWVQKNIYIRWFTIDGTKNSWTKESFYLNISFNTLYDLRLHLTIKKNNYTYWNSN